MADGYPFCVIAFEYHDGGRHSKFEPRIIVLIAAAPPRGASALVADGLCAEWTEGGVLVYARLRELSHEHVASVAVSALAAQLRAIGAEPLSALDEVPDPEPLDAHQAARELAVEQDSAADECLESRDVRCAECGAPSFVIDLVGNGRCPYCGRDQALGNELLEELREYHQRLHAAQLRAGHRTVGDLLAGPSLLSSEPDRVAQVCVRCGAPNQHEVGALDEACASCRAPLVARRTVMVRAVAIVSSHADRTRRKREAERALDRVARFSFSRKALKVVLAIGALVPALYYAGTVIVVACGKASGRGTLVTAAIALVALAAGLVLIGMAHLADRRKRARWQPRFESLAEQLGAVEVGGPVDLAVWAKRWWTDRLARDWLGDGSTQCTLLFGLAGFPIAVTMRTEGEVLGDLAPGMGQLHLVMLLAAQLPRDAPYWVASPDVAEIRQDLARAGVELELRTGGLALLATAALSQAIYKTPERLAFVAPLASTLARVAHLLRALPPS